MMYRADDKRLAVDIIDLQGREAAVIAQESACVATTGLLAMIQRQ